MCFGPEAVAAAQAVLAATAGEGFGTAAATAAATTAAAGAGAAGAGAGAAMTAAELAELEAALQAAGATTEATAGISSPGLMGATQHGSAGLLRNSMESALMDTGYTPSSLWEAAKNAPGSGQGFGQTMGNWAGNTGNRLMQTAQNNPTGLLAGGGGDKGMGMMMANMGMNMMQPGGMQAPPPAPPMQASREPLPQPYGNNSMSGPPPGMTMEEWMRRKRMMGRM